MKSEVIKKLITTIERAPHDKVKLQKILQLSNKTQMYSELLKFASSNVSLYNKNAQQILDERYKGSMLDFKEEWFINET